MATKKTYYTATCMTVDDIEKLLNIINSNGGEIVNILPWNTAVQAVIVYSKPEGGERAVN